ncbi:MAG: hypothetical protein Q8918_14085 [Bacteroidota bacterium]|nr:hypothetical protein [Bacteroidota bacterium]
MITNFYNIADNGSPAGKDVLTGLPNGNNKPMDAGYGIGSGKKANLPTFDL